MSFTPSRWIARKLPPLPRTSWWEMQGSNLRSHTFGRVCSTAELIAPPNGSLVQGCDGLTARVYPPEMPVQADGEEDFAGAFDLRASSLLSKTLHRFVRRIEHVGQRGPE